MWHRMNLVGRDGSRFHLVGRKIIRDDPGPDLWYDSSTLFFELREQGPGGRRLGTGTVHVSVRDLMRQVTTLTSRSNGSLTAMRARFRFIRFFLGRLNDVYGGVVMPLFR